MQKAATLNLRVNPEVKRNAEIVLTALGLSMSAAINIYLKKIASTGGIPFDLSVAKVPADINADMMMPAELQGAIAAGISEADKGQAIVAAEAFAEFRSQH